MDLNALLKDFLYCRGDIQEFVNRRFKSPDKSAITYNYYDYVTMKDGTKFYVTKDFRTIEEVMEDYRFDGLTSGHTVLDLGANIGGLQSKHPKEQNRLLLSASKRSKRRKSITSLKTKKAQFCKGLFTKLNRMAF